MTNTEIAKHVQTLLPPALRILNAEVMKFDKDLQSINICFDVSKDYCHSENIVQGGFISGMLDGAMAYAVIGLPDQCDMVATLEIKTSFISPGVSGEFTATGKVIHLGRSIGYLAGELYQNNNLVATASSTVKLLKK